jgi:hypothetical protein
VDIDTAKQSIKRTKSLFGLYQLIIHNIEWQKDLWIAELEGCGKKPVEVVMWDNVSAFAWGIGENHENLIHNTRGPDRDSIRSPSEYKSDALLLNSKALKTSVSTYTTSVIRMTVRHHQFVTWTFTSSLETYCVSYLLICLTDSNEIFLVVILVLSYLLVSLVPYWHTRH